MLLLQPSFTFLEVAVYLTGLEFHTLTKAPALAISFCKAWTQRFIGQRTFERRLQGLGAMKAVDRGFDLLGEYRDLARLSCMC